ncbi:MAG: hypothetical protein RMN25_06080 [Anaerolineae bacterium]|nr:hypothetical protein [Thermoflexales bacterium]MDW8407335.1 hypothetical protein [Anaerolineae bacterium]
MTLIERISLALRTAADQIVRVATPARRPHSAEQTIKLLEQAERHLKGLNGRLAEAIAHEQRAGQAWQAAVDRMNAVEAQATAPPNENTLDEGLSRPERLRRAQAEALAAERAYRSAATAVERLRIEIESVQAQLEAARTAATRHDQPPEHEAIHARSTESTVQSAQIDAQRADIGTQRMETDDRDVPDRTRIADLLGRQGEKRD